MEIENYERKTFVVQAVRVTLENMPDVVAWCGGNLKQDEQHRPYIRVEVRLPKNVKQTMAYEGDWVLKTGTGVRIYTDHAFHKSFDPTEKAVDPYQQQNTFDLPGIDRKVVVEKPVGDEKVVQGESVETRPETDEEFGERAAKAFNELRKTPFARTPEQIREAHRTGGSRSRNRVSDSSEGGLEYARLYGVYPDGRPFDISIGHDPGENASLRSVSPIWSDGTSEDLTRPVASDGQHATYLENYYDEHGYFPGQNPNPDHA